MNFDELEMRGARHLALQTKRYHYRARGQDIWISERFDLIVELATTALENMVAYGWSVSSISQATGYSYDIVKSCLEALR